VSKSAVELPDDFARAMGLDPAALRTPPEMPRLSRFTPLEELEKALCRRIEALDVPTLAGYAVREALDRLRGRV
jgi:hypothetical protein